MTHPDGIRSDVEPRPEYVEVIHILKNESLVEVDATKGIVEKL